MVYWPDLFGLTAWRWPTQALGIVLSLGVLAVLYVMWRRNSLAGAVLGLYGITYGLGDGVIQGLRGDEAVMWAGWRAAQWADAALVLCGVLLVVMAWNKRRRLCVETTRRL
jgi:prolipoprotein diacylglyceryltransferase